MTCPSCGAAMRVVLDGFTCDYCHAVAFAAKNDEGIRILGPSQDAICPICSIALMDASLTGVRLSYCARCRGMSIPMASFAGLIDQMHAQPPAAIAPPTDPRDMQRRIACPHCLHPMIADWYAGAGHVIVDTCEGCCLIWLDHGELQRIVQGSPPIQTQPLFDEASL